MGQLEIFPRANAEDIKTVKAMVDKYPTMRRRIEVLSKKAELTPIEKEVYKEYSTEIENVETAIESIADAEIRQIMKYRFIENFPRKSAVVRWRTFTDRTFDRKIVEGFKAMADVLKLYGKI
ncbi:hypothetical protein M5W83_11620 [Paenibacillus thiaminolyticus]|uniref:PCRF domain-containing protein n=1 Tax=Paenibacillus thiaminolyticus TaxID=49283 RepID=A0AAP9J0V4_PANTH|nr:hypothetical protein [Paenibacillus thiaminolyticus]MCY9533741.1 hypothetical protein [Paenibacillus thiaminolyticus]MCY9600232.1 hypothetical protein [Paenibacillus thiaminolyticus]MCY9607792.1 hypothetical protein [Paenibacillus thiaminolyticus]MCY9611955.1 hypothetical protein [Paenibacillus thiaminolyticus]MCY9617825.1 hypothetical protein [Paenibacillus thiaminolyticus]